MKILVSNAGSTSLKFKLFEMDGERALCDARVAQRPFAVHFKELELQGCAPGIADQYLHARAPVFCLL